jgi:sulfite exporter TauE/SafE
MSSNIKIKLLIIIGAILTIIGTIGSALSSPKTVEKIISAVLIIIGLAINLVGNYMMNRELVKIKNHINNN